MPSPGTIFLLAISMGDGLAGQRPSQTLAQPLPARSRHRTANSSQFALRGFLSASVADLRRHCREGPRRQHQAWVDRVEIIDDETITYGNPQVVTGRMEMFVGTPLG